MKKKILLLIACSLLGVSLFAQDSTSLKKKKIVLDMSNRANDHFLLQAGYAGWKGMPDTINQAGVSKTFNVYLMMDYPFKSNPHLSMAFGPGIASDHILFSKTKVGIKESKPAMYFTNVADTNNFKKTKLATVYLEAPIEFRYSQKPLTGKGFKFAAGIKVGTLINAHTRNAKYELKGSSTTSDFIVKESSKRFFNKTRISATARFGYANFSVFASYQLTPLFKDGMGPVVKPFSIGITLSGL